MDVGKGTYTVGRSTVEGVLDEPMVTVRGEYPSPIGKLAGLTVFSDDIIADRGMAWCLREGKRMARTAAVDYYAKHGA